MLDGASLDAVVRFYIEDNLTQCMVIDLRSDLFRELATERKKRYLDLLTAQALETVQAGTEALDGLKPVSPTVGLDDRGRIDEHDWHFLDHTADTSASRRSIG